MAHGPPSRASVAAAPVSASASARVVGLGRPDRLADGGDDRPAKAVQHRPGEGVRRRANGHRIQPGAGEIANGGRIGERRDDGQRAGPERLRELDSARVEAGEAQGGGQVLDMGDQGIEARTPLGLEQPRNSGRIAGVGGETIDRLGRQDDELARRQGARGRLDVVQGARCAVSWTMTTTLASTTPGVLHLP